MRRARAWWTGRHRQINISIHSHGDRGYGFALCIFVLKFLFSCYNECIVALPALQFCFVYISAYHASSKLDISLLIFYQILIFSLPCMMGRSMRNQTRVHCRGSSFCRAKKDRLRCSGAFLFQRSSVCHLTSFGLAIPYSDLDFCR